MFHHVCNLEYHAEIRETMEFLQEKLFSIMEHSKKNTVFVNLFRAVTLCESQLAQNSQVPESQEEEEDDDPEATQLPKEYCDDMFSIIC